MSSESESISCGCAVLYVAFAISLGAFCSDYILYSVFGKDIPWYADMVVGLVLSSIMVPGAVICWVARLCGVEVPFVA